MIKFFQSFGCAVSLHSYNSAYEPLIKDMQAEFLNTDHLQQHLHLLLPEFNIVVGAVPNHVNINDEHMACLPPGSIILDSSQSFEVTRRDEVYTSHQTGVTVVGFADYEGVKNEQCEQIMTEGVIKALNSYF